MSNTQAIPEKLFDQSTCNTNAGISDRVTNKLKKGEFQIKVDVQNILK
jgi:hypothetical protein